MRVLCLGNELLGDDAFGVLAARRIAELCPEMDVIESSSSGLHLLDQICGCSELTVIDTVETGKAEPGTIYRLDEDSLPCVRGDAPHCTGLFDALRLARVLGLAAPIEVRVLAVEAADCRTIGGGMDERVRAALDEVVDLVLHPAAR